MSSDLTERNSGLKLKRLAAVLHLSPLRNCGASGASGADSYRTVAQPFSRPSRTPILRGKGGTAWNSTVFQHADGRDALRAVLRGVEPVERMERVERKRRKVEHQACFLRVGGALPLSPVGGTRSSGSIGSAAPGSLSTSFWLS